MFRNITICLLAGTLVGGCDAIQQKRWPTAQEIQDATKNLCGFVPTLQAVTNLLAANIQEMKDIASGAAMICWAVVPKGQVAPGQAPRKPEIQGIVIEGRWS